MPSFVQLSCKIGRRAHSKCIAGRAQTGSPAARSLGTRARVRRVHQRGTISGTSWWRRSFLQAQQVDGLGDVCFAGEVGVSSLALEPIAARMPCGRGASLASGFGGCVQHASRAAVGSLAL
jgi:hypothetical protein